MSMHASLRGAALCLWLCATAAVAAPDCEEPPAVESRVGDAASGRQLLGQGIALYESRRLDQAEKALQASLFAGLPDRRERATAHKYLAFVFCTHKEWARCDAAFDAALDARPSFALAEYELQGTPWRDAYHRAQGKRGWRCSHAGAGTADGRRTTGTSSGSFALNSTVIVAITPLLPAAGLPVPHDGASTSTALARLRPRSENNLQLRVAPWAHVTINGKRIGVTPPLTEYKLPPGAHTVELANPGFETVRRTLKIDSDEAITITHDFDAR
ncbi:PEGA domain-containing protein [Paracidovorax sp. MALMAid1276]|uniref:PEGA domain-containing protein n=1 Tax=Paracidovorax sp. MALMAid1276 TaxID=3411631 RepID=UPI003B9A1B96